MDSSSFEAASAAVQANSKEIDKLDNDTKLELYALFKQSNVGDNATPKPGMLDFKGKAKWEAWGKKKGVSSADAKVQYVELAKKLLPGKF